MTGGWEQAGTALGWIDETEGWHRMLERISGVDAGWKGAGEGEESCGLPFLHLGLQVDGCRTRPNSTGSTWIYLIHYYR